MQELLDQFFELLKQTDEAIKIQIRALTSNNVDFQDTKSKWEEVQVKLLKLLIQTYCIDQQISHHLIPDDVWSLISQIMKRTIIDCKLQFATTRKKIRLLQQQWQKKEDEALKEICVSYQAQNRPFKWNEIAKELAQKLNQQNVKMTKIVRDRWLNKLNPNIQRGPWEKNEEYELCKQLLKHGKNWMIIAIEMKNSRTENSIKNRYFNILRKLEKQDVPILSKTNIEKQLTKFQLNESVKLEQFGQQEISFILYQLSKLEPNIIKTKEEFKSDNKVQKKTNGSTQNSCSKKLSKADEKDEKLHAKNIIKKVLKQYEQDENLDINKMKDYYQEVVAQKGDTVELDEEPISDSENLSEVQFAVMGKDSQKLHLFPKSQLKVVMELMKQKKEQKKDVQSSLSKIQSLPPPLPKLEQKLPQPQQQQQSQPQQQQQNPQQIFPQTSIPPQPQVPVQLPIVQPIMQPVALPTPVIPIQQQHSGQQQQHQQQQQPSQQQQQQQQQYYQLVYPSNFMYPQVQMAPVAQIPILPGQMMGQIPGQMVGQIPGQMVSQIPGQIVNQIPGQMVGQLPGQMMGQIPGQMGQMVGQIPSQMVSQIPAQVVSTIPGQIPQIISQLPPQMMQQVQGQIPQMVQPGQMATVQNGQIQMSQIASVPQIAQMPLQSLPLTATQSVGMPQQFIPIIYTPQPGQLNQQQKTNSQQQQVPIMNYQIPMMPQYGDQYFQFMNMNQTNQQKQPKYSQVKQEMEEQQQQQQNRK
ncbi:unnamed protein product [Paramecium pentaurelia]|uniref:Uncharacterized protein n=1 Tax=Paramecium pentaurelia TaxID=43138 RepID=A0A8S1XY66_9CILI|nr:unnamed protein product [Paramecium pentaurelia]